MDNALNYEEAMTLAAEYQYLVGQPMSAEYRSMGVVERVAVVPFDVLHKSYYLDYYQIFKDADKCLSYFKDTTEYDVVLISSDKEQNNSMRELCAHLAYQKSSGASHLVLD